MSRTRQSGAEQQVDHPPVVTGHSILVHIEQLVLHGFNPGDRRRIARAVEAELARLVREETPPQWQQNLPALERINGGSFRVQAGANPQAAGAQIARAVFRGLRQHLGASARPAARFHRP